MDLNETVDKSWNDLNINDKTALLQIIGRGKTPILQNADEIDPETRGRLILAHRDGRPGFSAQEFHRGKDFYLNKNPNIIVRKAREISYKIGRVTHPNLHD